jgi:hypothetical protein
VAIALLALVALVVYGCFRTRYVGGPDSWGYYSTSLVFRGRSAGLETRFDVERFPAVAPLAYTVLHGRIVPFGQPGYPALMAVAGMLGLEFWVNPVLGALSIVLIYVSLLRTARPAIAFALAAAWAACPIVCWASVKVMSDLAACVFPLLGYLLLSSGRIGGAGAALGFSLAVRPTNLFLIPAFAWMARRVRRVRPFAIGFVVAVSAYGIHNWIRNGAPWVTTYNAKTDEVLSSDVAPKLFLWFLRTSFGVLSAPISALFVIGVAQRRWSDWPLLLWIALPLAFYSNVMATGDVWWYSRYLLPSYPAVFLLSGTGAEYVVRHLEARRPGFVESRRVGVAAALAWAVLVFGYFGKKNLDWGFFTTRRALDSYTNSLAVAGAVPSGSVVGSSQYSGALRLYGHLETFKIGAAKATAFVSYCLEHAIPLFVIVEPGDNREFCDWLEENHTLREAMTLPASPSSHLYRVEPKAH